VNAGLACRHNPRSIGFSSAWKTSPPGIPKGVGPMRLADVSVGFKPLIVHPVGAMRGIISSQNFPTFSVTFCSAIEQ
jgi:hypothetical protein